MATVSSFPSFTIAGMPEFVNVLCAYNPIQLVMAKGAGEEWIQIKAEDPDTNVLFETQPRPFFGTTVIFNIAPLLQSALLISDNSRNDRLQATFANGEAQQFTLYQRTNITGAWVAISVASLTAPYLATVSARQLGNVYGCTLADYVPYVDSIGSTVVVKGAFLTKFEEVPLWYYSSKESPATASDVSVFYPTLYLPMFDNAAQRDFLGAVYLLDVGGTVPFDSKLPTPASQLPSVPIVDAEEWVWNKSAFVLKAGIGTAPALPLESEILAEITIRPRKVCANPYAVKWLNSLGGFDVWVFDRANSPILLESESAEGIYGVQVGDISLSSESANTYAKTSTQSITLFASHLSLNEKQQLEGILQSPLVRLYVGELADGIAFEDWHTVIVENATTIATDTENATHKFELTLRLPQLYHPNN